MKFQIGVRTNFGLLGKVEAMRVKRNDILKQQTHAPRAGRNGIGR
jgi:hypothetical protein